ncbi:MAG: hypothetical protein KDH20_09750 [Rhodocyclaceae bacterium]|nr:hypothetical protein [Rhodocyclaceae bacterium]
MAAPLSTLPDTGARDPIAASPGDPVAAAVAPPATAAGSPPPRAAGQAQAAVSVAPAQPSRALPAPPAGYAPTSARAAVDGPPPAARPETHAAAPRLTIGRIEVTVLGEAKPPPKPRAAADDAFLSKHYLRRL